jgi:hypothetical protein
MLPTINNAAIKLPLKKKTIPKLQETNALPDQIASKGQSLAQSCSSF